MKSSRPWLQTVILVWIGMVLAASGLVVYLLARQTVLGDADQFVRDKAFLLGTQVNPNMPTAVGGDDRVWRTDRFLSFGQTHDAEWKILYKSARLEKPIPPTEELKRLASHSLGVVLHDATGTDGALYRMATIRVERLGRFVCYAQVAIFQRDRDRPLRQLAAWLAGGVLLGLAGAGVGTRFLVGQWNMALTSLSSAARDIQVRNLSRRRLFVPEHSPDLATLAQGFNDLLDRLEAALSGQRQFVADASHELRTPLAALQAEIDVALRRERTPDDYRRTLEANRYELERLSALVENLLALAALDADAAPRAKSPVELGTVCRDVAEQLSPLAARHNVRLELNVDDDATVDGDPCALERAVRNLIENAIRYTPAGETIAIRTRREGANARVDVVDAGIGISEDHLPHLFERFYRVDTARSRAHGGAGLGLSIVKAIVESHGGSVSVESRLGVGSTFTLLFPIRG